MSTLAPVAAPDRLYLTAHHALVPSADPFARLSEVSWLFDPAEGPSTRSTAATGRLTDAVVFQTPVLDEPLTVSGRVRFSARVRCTAPFAPVSVRVVHASASGDALVVAAVDTWILASAEASPLDVDLGTVEHTAEAGSVLELRVWSPAAAAMTSPAAGTLTFSRQTLQIGGIGGAQLLWS